MRCCSARWAPWRTRCWCAGTSSGSSTSARVPCPRSSLDRERALHAAGLVAGDGAVELVLARLEVRRGDGLAALVDSLALLRDVVALDLDRVRVIGRVVHRDRDLAGVRGE